MSRLILGLSTACLLAAAAPAFAQNPAKQADQLNEQGKALLNAKPMRAAEATLKFRAAIVLSPEGRFYLNLCMSLYQEGKLTEAITACDAVEAKGATKAQVTQANVIVEKFIKPRMAEVGANPDNGNQNGNPDNGNGNPDNGNGNPDNGNGNPDNGNGNPDNGNGNPDNGNGNPDNGNGNPDNGNQNGNGTGNVTVAPPPSLFTQTTAKPLHEYTWTLGVQLMGLATTIGEKGQWQRQSGGFRLLGDYAISRDKQFGAQGYLSFFSVDATNDNFVHDGESLGVLDLGVGVFKEKCKGRLCVKPLAGAQVALIFPSDAMDDSNQQGFAALGVRGELGLEYALGSRYENVLTAGVGLNLYFPASENDAVESPADWGLDKASANAYFAIGFTRRFASPIGSQPLFTLQ